MQITHAMHIQIGWIFRLTWRPCQQHMNLLTMCVCVCVCFCNSSNLNAIALGKIAKSFSVVPHVANGLRLGQWYDNGMLMEFNKRRMITLWRGGWKIFGRRVHGSCHWHDDGIMRHDKMALYIFGFTWTRRIIGNYKLVSMSPIGAGVWNVHTNRIFIILYSIVCGDVGCMAQSNTIFQNLIMHNDF